MSTNAHEPVTDDFRLELTHRLNREGRWIEAEMWKNDRIKQLRSTGLKRSEASQQAWREVSELFPPLPQEAIDAYGFVKMLTRRDFPPDHNDEPDEIPLSDLWYPLMTVIAVHTYREQLEELEPCQGSNLHGLRTELVIDGPTRVSRLLGALYMESPIRFLEVARERLVAVLGRCDWKIERELKSILTAVDRILGAREAETNPSDFDFDAKRQADLMVMSLKYAVSTAPPEPEPSVKPTSTSTANTATWS